jgi:uncharacterized protein
MKIILTDKEKIILRFDKGGDVIKELIKFSKKQNITTAHFTGLGACGSVTLSYYDLENKKYLDKTFDEDLEIVSLTGNVAKLKKETVIHAHGVFSDRNYQTVGGHVKELIVSATCEVHLTVLKGKMEREYDKKTGLNLLS